MSLLHVHVEVRVVPGREADFLAATTENARESRNEPGVVRFDCLRSTDDPSRFLLIEIYRDADAAAAHKETAHYLTWRDTVADWMAQPRSSTKWENLDPDDQHWGY